MTAWELIDFLQSFPPDQKVVFISPMPNPNMIKVLSVDKVDEERTDREYVIALRCEKETVMNQN